jgi:hypothetical protein
MSDKPNIVKFEREAPSDYVRLCNAVLAAIEASDAISLSKHVDFGKGRHLIVNIEVYESECDE